MQTATPTPPRLRGGARRKKTVLIASAALVIIAALVMALVLTNANNRNSFPLRAVMIPGAQPTDLQTPKAMRYDLDTANAAQAYFDRLMDSGYIGLRGEAAEGPQPDGSGWTVREKTADGTVLAAAFDEQGLVTSLSVTPAQSGDLKAANPPYQLGSGDDTLFNYIRSFTCEYLPDVVIVSGEIAADQYNDEGRFITVLADNDLATGAYEFVVQIDPVSRIVGFRVLGDPAVAFVRTSRMVSSDGETGGAADNPEASGLTGPVTSNIAVQLARDALIESLGIPADEVAGYVMVDVSLYTGEEARVIGLNSSAVWVVSFRMPETDEAMYCDYSLYIDEQTGEILRILDPSNISNG